MASVSPDPFKSKSRATNNKLSQNHEDSTHSFGPISPVKRGKGGGGSFAANGEARAKSKINMIPVEELFILKCKLCSVVFSLEVKNRYFEAKEAKRETLLELIEVMDGEKQNEGAVASARFYLLKSEQAMTNLFKMISINLFRTPKVSVNKFGGQQED